MGRRAIAGPGRWADRFERWSPALSRAFIVSTLETFVFHVRGGRWRGSRPRTEALLRALPPTVAPSYSP